MAERGSIAFNRQCHYAVEAHARDEARQKDVDRRIIPWVPWKYQAAHIISLLAGVLGWSVVCGWWKRIWPPEQREEYRGVAGYRAAQTARFLAYFLIFLPTVGGRL